MIIIKIRATVKFYIKEQEAKGEENTKFPISTKAQSNNRTKNNNFHQRSYSHEKQGLKKLHILFKI